MNKQYKVDEEGNVKVIKENSEVIDYGKYHKQTQEILSLENYSEETQEKINSFDKIIKELSNKIYKKNKFNRTLNITLTIIITLFLIASIVIDITSFLIILISIIPISLIVGIIENKVLTKNRQEIKYYNQRSKEENHILSKIKTKIELLKQDKTKIDYVSDYQEVPPIKNYNLDPSDYFIEKYQLEKRVREMTKGKTKKLTRKINTNNLYKT